MSLYNILFPHVDHYYQGGKKIGLVSFEDEQLYEAWCNISCSTDVKENISFDLLNLISLIAEIGEEKLRLAWIRPTC